MAGSESGLLHGPDVWATADRGSDKGRDAGRDRGVEGDGDERRVRRLEDGTETRQQVSEEQTVTWIGRRMGVGWIAACGQWKENCGEQGRMAQGGKGTKKEFKCRAGETRLE